ncbi:hypothetical protein P2Q70_08300 [Pseudomonas mendocina]|uniref:RHS repeat-associated core domain-containing protein n=1 Tax=Ectopseudomonas mendocina TaxID=300 RepID=UPI0023D991C3|nr:RHS repeat-associated core domain-containing protein [Pseudomonas mendocina]MDF2074569.1 hypothetical protein [Pseudomonas mendocina]
MTWRAEAQAFGETQVVLNTIDNALRFPGQYFDEETGLYQNYFRDYDPQLGRYVQGDPAGRDGGLNWYGYAEQAPLVFTDYFGLWAAVGAAGGAGAAAGAGVAAGSATVGGGAVDGADPWGDDGSGSTGRTRPTREQDSSRDRSPRGGAMEMAAPGNVGDTGIEGDYGSAVSDAKCRGLPVPERCEWLAKNASLYSDKRVKAQAKKWGCKGSRYTKGGKSR